VLLTTERAANSAPDVVAGAAAVLHIPHGSVPEAAAAVRQGVEGRPLVALGGGRVIDSTKAISGADGLRCAAIPTTLSGAEMTPFHRMPAGVDRFSLVRPSLVVAAPDLMASQQLPELAASAMNALAHAVEALYTPLANPVAELAALAGCESIAAGLRDAQPDGSELARGALLAGYASGVAGFAVHHAVCQTIVRVVGTPHAQTNAVMLPRFVRLVQTRAPQAVAKLAAALAAKDAADAVAALAGRAGVSSLSELGVERSQLDDVVDVALQHPALQNTPDPPDRAELLELLERAL
jgi:maleylacetate reductase